MRFEVAGASLTGVRDNNEDAFRVLPDQGVFALADGMGGLEHGEVMSAAAAEAVIVAAADLAQLARAIGGDQVANARRALFDRIEALFIEASGRLYSQAADAGLRMGTTLTTAVLAADRMVIGHVGDCRVLRVRDGQVSRLTSDHSVAAAQLRRGHITEAEYNRSPKRALLYQSLGPIPEVEPDLVEAELSRGDVYVMATDGVWAYVSDTELVELCGAEDLDAAAAAICQRAVDNGSDDNCTAVVIRVFDLGSHQPAGLLRSLTVSPLFKDFDERDLRLLAPFLATRDLLEGDVVMRESEYGSDMFVIVSGAVEISRQGIPLAQLGPGAHFGQLSLVGDVPRSASAQVSFPTRLLVLQREGIDAMCQRRPELATRLLRTLLADTAERLVDFTRRIGRAETALWQE